MGVVVGKQLRFDLRVLLLEDRGDAGVQLLPATAQQAAVGRLLDQCVLEAVGRLRRRAAPEHQLGIDQLLQGLLQIALAQWRHRGQQRIGELAPDRRTDLRHLLDRSEAVEARHQRVVQGRGNRERRQRVLLGVGDQPRFQHGLGQLLEEQRHAVGPRDDLVADLGRQCPTADQPLDHGRALAAAQPVELQQRGVCLGAPGRREVRPEGHHHQHADLLDALDHQTEELEGRGIDPLRILEDGQDRTLARQRLDLLDQHLEEPLLLALRAERERRIAGLVRQRQQGRDQRHDLARIACSGEQRFELVELLLRRFAADPAWRRVAGR